MKIRLYLLAVCLWMLFLGLVSAGLADSVDLFDVIYVDDIKANNGTVPINNWDKNASDDYGATWSTKAGDYNASAGDYLIVEDNATVTGPASASEGDMIVIACGGDWATTNSEFDPNGLNIMGDNATLTLDTNMGFTLVYSSNATWGWAMY